MTPKHPLCHSVPPSQCLHFPLKPSTLLFQSCASRDSQEKQGKEKKCRPTTLLPSGVTQWLVQTFACLLAKWLGGNWGVPAETGSGARAKAGPGCSLLSHALQPRGDMRLGDRDAHLHSLPPS